MAQHDVRRIEAHELRRFAVAAEVDSRTLRRVIVGEPTRGLQRTRIERALREAGYQHLVGPDGGGDG